VTAPGRLVEVVVLASRQSYKAGANRVRLSVDGPSVFIEMANTVRELPRAACALIYAIKEEPKLARKVK
jgi:hypothetical protein